MEKPLKLGGAFVLTVKRTDSVTEDAKTIGRMIDKLEADTERVKKQVVKPDSIEEGCAIGLAIAVLIWIVLVVGVTKLLGVW